MSGIDVLHVMDGLWGAQAPGFGPDTDSFNQARAAIAALIAQRDALRAELASAVAAEREACAKVCDRFVCEAQKVAAYEGVHWVTNLAEAIRARGAK